MQADAASLGETPHESSCSIPFSAQKTDHDSLKLNCETDQAEEVDVVYCAALESQSHGSNEKLTNDIEESLRDASEVRRLSLVEDNAGTKEVNCASEEGQHGEMIYVKGAGMNECHDIPQEKQENPQNSSCVVAEVSNAVVDPGMFSTEEMESAGGQEQYLVTLGLGSTERKKEKYYGAAQICPTNNVTRGSEDCICSNDDHEEAPPANVDVDAAIPAENEGPTVPQAPPANVDIDVAGFDDSLEKIVLSPYKHQCKKV